MPRSKKTKDGRAPVGPGRSYSMPPSMCLKCGYFIDRASAITGKKGRPVEGDYTVCLNCGALHRFDPKLNLVPTTLDAARDMLKPEALQKVVLSQQFIQMRGPIPNKDRPS
jgi:hypothetical protein